MATTFAATLTLDATDFDTLKDIKAAWSKTLLAFGVTKGNNALSSDETTKLYRVVEDDTKGLTKALPGTNKNVKLAEKVWDVLYSMV